MSKGGRAALAIWVDVDPADDSHFEHWHSAEHLQERVSCPGWRRGSRFKSVDRPGRFLLFYDADTMAAFESDAYYARLRDPTEWSRAIFPKFRETWRTVCTVERRWGEGIGTAALTLRLGRSEDAPFSGLVASDNVARVDLLIGRSDIGQAHTTEMDLRPAPDRQIERALIAFYWSGEEAKTARTLYAPSAELFALRHTVSKSDLVG